MKPRNRLRPSRHNTGRPVSVLILADPAVDRYEHHFVTESGDAILFAPATAVTLPVSSTRYAVLPGS